MVKQAIPWTVAFLEGFSTLAVEVIAIRLAVPVVGSSVVLTGVLLGIVLFALSIGYWRGGALAATWTPEKTRRVLARNLLLAALLYGAIAFPLEAPILAALLDSGTPLALSIGLAASVLYLVPLYLASQTVPMLAELTNIDGHAGRASGRILFFSTLGSVAGGILTSVWLFPTIGVRYSGFLVCAMLIAGALAMALPRIQAMTALVLLAAIAAATHPRNRIFYFDSEYQTIEIVRATTDSGRPERVLTVGGGRASGVFEDTGETSFAYSRAAYKALEEWRATSLLVIGAAGFNLPRDAARLPGMTIIDAVDVDPVMRTIAEREFLRQPLPPIVNFFPLSARYAARRFGREGRHYSAVFLDAYFGQSMPEELVTLEFFEDIHRLAPRVFANLITDRDLETPFSLHFLATFRQAFGAVYLLDVAPSDKYHANYLITSAPITGAKPWLGMATPYHDDSSRAAWDFVAMRWD